MASLYRTRALWQNWPGAPGYSNFYSLGGGNADAVEAFFTAINGLLPNGMTITVPPSGDIIDDSTGNLTGTWSLPGTGGVVTSSATVGAYPGASGAVVHWRTNGFVGGRNVRGRTFLVPLTGASFSQTGDLDTSRLGTLQTAASGLVTAGGGNLAVWRRPTTFTGGSSHIITSATVPDLAVVLRSRRV